MIKNKKITNVKIKLKNLPQKLWSIISSTDIDFFFIFLTTYMFIPTTFWLFRLLGSIGLSYVYKMITKTLLLIRTKN